MKLTKRIKDSWNIRKETFSPLKVSSLHCSINYVNSPFCSVNIILKLRAFIRNIYKHSFPSYFYQRKTTGDELRYQERGGEMEEKIPDRQRRGRKTKWSERLFLSTLACTIKLTATQQKNYFCLFLSKYFIQNEKKVSFFRRVVTLSQKSFCAITQ